MNGNSNTMTPDTPPRVRESVLNRLRHVQDRVRTVSRQISFAEGRLLDFADADRMQQTLNAALSDMRELTITLAVMERKIS